MNIRLYILFALGLLFFFSCGNKTKQVDPIPPTTVNSAEGLPKEFKDFYQQFHKDSVFQLERITFPLEGIPNYIDSSFSGTHYWKKRDWIMHKPFDPAFSGFERTFSYNEYMVEEIIKDGNHFGTMRRFYKMDDDWMLIYYAGMNKIRQ